MNTDEFLHEVKSSPLCPENFDKIYSVFQEMQSESLSTLLELHRICEKHGIDYQLAFGSLLGVIRDGGQIPWDYDVDVFVPINQKEKLIEALNNELDEEYYYYSPEKDKRCRHVIMRISPKKYRSEALHVDVFYYIGSPDNSKKRKKFMHEVKTISKLRFYKLVNCKEESVGRLRRYINLLIHKTVYLVVPIKYIERKYNRLCHQYSLSSSNFYIEADNFADYYSFPSEIMRCTIMKTTTLGEFRIPANYERMLEIYYGDYHVIPSLENRLRDIQYNYKRFIRFNN